MDKTKPQDDQVQPTGGQDMPEDPGYSYDDIKKDSVRDIAANTDEPTEKPVEDTKPDEPTPPATEEPEVSLEDVGKKIAGDTATALLAKQKEERDTLEAERITAEEKAKTPQDQAQEVVKEFEEKNGRTPTWEEAFALLEERATNKAIAAMDARQAERDATRKTQQEAQQKQEAQEKSDAEHLNTVIDDELGDLYNAGKLTRIVNKDNPSDPGILERKALFTKWAEVNAERRGKGLPDIVSATRIFEFYYQKPQGQPGANAPIAGNRTSNTPPGTEEEYSYADIKKPWSMFRKR